MSFSRRSTSRAESDSSQKRRGESYRYDSPSSQSSLEDWENLFVAECRAQSPSPSTRQINDWSMKLMEAKFRHLHLGVGGNEDLAFEWREYYKEQLVREFSGLNSDDPPPGWTASAMRPIDNSGKYSGDYAAHRGTPRAKFSSNSSYDSLPTSRYNYATKHRELYSPDGSYATRSTASPVTDDDFIKKEPEEYSLAFFNNSQYIKTENVREHSSVSAINPDYYYSNRSSRPPPACKRECSEQGNIVPAKQYDPDVYHGATLLTKIQRGISY